MTGNKIETLIYYIYACMRTEYEQFISDDRVSLYILPHKRNEINDISLSYF